MSFQWWDVVIILGLVLIIFGPKKLPEFAKGLGSAINEFKTAMSGVTDTDKDDAYKRLEKSAESQAAKKEEEKPEEKPAG